MAIQEGKRQWWTVPVIIAAWVGLAGFNLFALLTFGGWVGAADGFLPWSVAAALLWHVSRRKLGFQPLRYTTVGWVLLALWFTFLALAVAGIDERAWAPWPTAVVWTYLSLPIAPALLITIAMIRRAYAGKAAA